MLDRVQRDKSGPSALCLISDAAIVLARKQPLARRGSHAREEERRHCAEWPWVRDEGGGRDKPW
jgi:hypothetical protein